MLLWIQRKGEKNERGETEGNFNGETGDDSIRSLLKLNELGGRRDGAAPSVERCVENREGLWTQRSLGDERQQSCFVSAMLPGLKESYRGGKGTDSNRRVAND